MKIEKKELLEKLNKVKAGLSTKEIIEHGKHIAVTGDEIISFNDQISIGVGFKTDFSCFVPAEELLKIVSKIKSDEIQISFKNNILSIKSGNVSGQLKCLDQDLKEFLENIRPAKKKLKWNNLPEDFIEGITMTVFSCSSDMTKPYLTCLNIQTDEIVSSDNIRISRFSFDKEKMKDAFLLPATSAKELLKIKNITQYAITNSWVFFKNKEGLTFCSRIVEADFPDVSAFFEIEGGKFSFPKTVETAISTASILAEGDYDFDKKIKVVVKDKKMTCKGEQDIGWVLEETEVSIAKNFSFVINPFFFMEVLKHTSNAKINDNVILFYSKNFQHLIMLFEDDK